MDFNLAKYMLSKSYTNCAIFEKDQKKHTALLQKLTNIAPTAFLAQEISTQMCDFPNSQQNSKMFLK